MTTTTRIILVFLGLAIGFTDHALGDSPSALKPLPAEQWDARKAAHLLRRAGFGGTYAEITRLAKMPIDQAVSYLVDYQRQKAQWEFDLTSLVVPEADAVAEAGRLVQCLPELWAAADLGERRRLLLTVLDAVYVDAREAKAVVSVRPKAAFDEVIRACEQVASAI